MKKTLAGLAAVVLGGGLVLLSAMPASAHTHDVQVDCNAIVVDLQNYAPQIAPTDPTDEVIHHDAIGTPTIKVDNPDYVPATEGSPAVTKTQYEFKHIITGKTRWEDDPKWNAQGNLNSIGWYKTGNTQTIEVTPAIPPTPAVGEPQIDAPNPDYVAPWDETVHHDGTPGAGNHITVTIGGNIVDDTNFGTSYNETYKFADPTISNTWSVDVTAYDSDDYSFHQEGTTSDCAIVIPPTDEPTTPPTDEPTTPPVTDTPTVTPVPLPSASIPAKPAEVTPPVTLTSTEETPTEELAHTGSNLEDYRGIGFIGGGILLLGILTAVTAAAIGSMRDRRKARNQQ